MVNSDRDTVTGQDTSGDASPGDGPSPDETGDAAGPGSLGRSPGFRHDGLRLAELLAARLCHEVSDSADTLAGAVEIARTEPGSAAEALAIAAKAAAVLAARLRLLRAA